MFFHNKCPSPALFSFEKMDRTTYIECFLKYCFLIIQESKGAKFEQDN